MNNKVKKISVLSFVMVIIIMAVSIYINNNKNVLDYNTNTQMKYTVLDPVVLNDDDVVFEYIHENTGENKISEQEYDKHIINYQLYFSENIGIYEMDTYTYTTEIMENIIYKVNYDNGVKMELARNSVQGEENQSITITNIVSIDNDKIVYSYYDEDTYSNIIVLTDLDLNNQEILFNKVTSNSILDVRAIDEGNIVVFYIIDEGENWVYSYDIIDTKTKNIKNIYQTTYNNTTETGNVSPNLSVNDEEIIIFTTFYDKGKTVIRKVIVIDTNYNNKKEYEVNIDNSGLIEINDSYEMDNEQDYRVSAIEKVGDYIALSSVGARTIKLFKIIDEKLVELYLPNEFYEWSEVQMLINSKIDSKYIIFKYGNKAPNIEPYKPRGMIFFDTETEKLYKVDIVVEGKYQESTIGRIRLDNYENILINLTTSNYLEPDDNAIIQSNIKTTVKEILK